MYVLLHHGFMWHIICNEGAKVRLDWLLLYSWDKAWIFYIKFNVLSPWCFITSGNAFLKPELMYNVEVFECTENPTKIPFALNSFAQQQHKTCWYTSLENLLHTYLKKKISIKLNSLPFNIFIIYMLKICSSMIY